MTEDIFNLDEYGFEKANYIGNKERLAQYIVKKFPDDGKVIFDPMCGCSSVLIEAARSKGYRVIANDLSIMPFWFSKGVFEGVQLSEQDAEKIMNAPPADGWLTTEWKGMYPRRREIRRFIDGLVKIAGTFRDKKLLSARAVASRFLQTMYSDSGSGYSTRNWETIADAKRVLSKSIKEVNTRIAEIGGKGRVTSVDARQSQFPKSDVVYFDPPFFPKNKGPVKYFDTYRITNSILLQKQWKEKNLVKEEVPEILRKLCKSTRTIFISTTRSSKINWAAELGKHKKAVKKFRISYRQTSGFPAGREENQDENLLFGKAVRKQDDPYMLLPSEDTIHRYVCHHHFRGKSIHADFRIESMENKDLIGWTINNMIPDSIQEPVTAIEQAKSLKIDEYSKIDWQTGEFAKRKKSGTETLVDVELVCEKKAVEPHPWLEIEGVVKPGTVGATKQYPGVFLIVDKGTCEYGAQKPWVHEYFPQSDRNKGGFRYRILFRQLRVEAIQGKSEEDIRACAVEFLNESFDSVFSEDWDLDLSERLKARDIVMPAAETTFRQESAWLLIKPSDQTPYVLSDRAVKEKWIAPKGFSSLPKDLRTRIPVEFKYWMIDKEKDRVLMRDALFRVIDNGKVR